MAEPARRASLPPTVRALAAVSFLTDAASEMLYPLMPAFLATVLGASPAFVGTIEGAAESTAALLKVASGWWSDRVGRAKPLVVLGYGLATVARPLVSLSTAAWQVLALRLVDRTGKGIRSAPRDALLAASVEARDRGRAFGFHRAADHAGAVAGPLLAFVLLQGAGLELRTVFALSAIPGLLSLAVLVLGVRETPRPTQATRADAATPDASTHAPGVAAPPLPRRFWAVLATILVFTLGNSTDAFLLLRAQQLGVPVALLPLLWAAHHVVKSGLATPFGALSDRLGRRTLLLAGWAWYAAVYAGFALATDAWHAWALFLLYGVHFALVEGAERALVADLVPAARRGVAFGWFNAAVGVAAFPASLLLGLAWDAHGARVAFLFGASIAAVACVLGAVALPRRERTA
jgi:MFS family permease